MHPVTQFEAKRLTITPGAPLCGQIGTENGPVLPGDKSLSHRAALLAAMADGPSRTENFLVSGVTRAMLNALTTLGVPWELNGTTLSVQGQGLQRSPVAAPVMIDCGNSATTLRLLAGAMAAWGVEATLDGSPGLRRRPMRRIVEPLRQMGVSIEDTEGCAPLVLRPSVTPLKGLDYTLSVASAQVKSCLLLAALAGNSPTTLREPGPSRDHTERMLRAMGVEVHSEPTANSRQPSAGGALAPNSYFLTHLSPPRPLNLAPLHTVLPGDISAAAFLIVAALITPGSQVSLRGVGLNPTRTGLLDALAAMGADITITDQSERSGEPVGNLTIRHCQLEGVQIGGDLVVRMIDEFPAFAIAAAYATGVTTVSDAVELRHKESDRISDLAQELRRLGVEIAETPDGFVVHGGRPLSGGLIWPHGDHRLAMSLAIAGLAAQEPVTIQEAGIIHESFPGFAETLQTLGADIRLEE